MYVAKTKALIRFSHDAAHFMRCHWIWFLEIETRCKTFAYGEPFNNANKSLFLKGMYTEIFLAGGQQSGNCGSAWSIRINNQALPNFSASLICYMQRKKKINYPLLFDVQIKRITIICYNIHVHTCISYAIYCFFRLAVRASSKLMYNPANSSFSVLFKLGFELSPSHTFTVLAPVELRFTPIYQIVAHRHDS